MSQIGREPGRRIVLVTGAARGIGLACAQRFVELGDCVAILDLDGGRVRDVAAELCQSSSAQVVGFEVDVGDERAVSEVAGQVQARLGGVDVVVNNAGVGGGARTELLSLAEWSKILDVNLTGTFLVTRAFVHGMIERRHGVIVNMSSILGLTGMPSRAAYSVAKAGIIALTKVTSAEWARFGIRVNAVAPGYVGTEGVGQGIASGIIRPEQVAARTPTARLAKPDEIAAAVAFLASDEASYLTGHVLAVDGGYTAYGAWWNAQEDAPGIG